MNCEVCLMPPRKASEFRVHGNAAVKKPKKKNQPQNGPVVTRQVNPVALRVAKDIAGRRDVHLVFNADGSVEIRNGGK